MDAMTDIFSYLVLSEDSVADKLTVVDRYAATFPGDAYGVFFDKLKEYFKQFDRAPSYEYLVKNYGFNYVLGATSYKASDIFDIIRREAERRKRGEAAVRLQNLAAGTSALPLDKVISEVDRIKDIFKGTSEGRPELSVRELYDIRKTRPAGMLTGMSPIDASLRSIELGTVFTLAGFTGSYKTTAAVNMAYYNAVNLGYDVAYVTLEVTKDVLRFMALSRHSWDSRFAGKGQPVEARVIRECGLTDEQYKFLFEVVEPDLRDNSQHGKLYFFDESDLESLNAAGMRKKFLDIGNTPDAIFLDYIQLFQYAKGNARQGLSVIDALVQEFRGLALDCNGKLTTVYILSQTSRAGWLRSVKNKGKYDLMALAESHELERASYYVVFLFTDELLRVSGEVKVTLAKNRGGEVIPDPVVVFVDPRYCLVGGGASSGFAGGAVEQDLSSLIGDGFAF